MAAPLAQTHVPPTPLPRSRPKVSSPASRRRTITDRAVRRLMTLTILELEDHLIPAQGEDEILYVYAGDIVVTHDLRRTLEVFDGDVNEAIENIRAFVLDGILGTPDGAS